MELEREDLTKRNFDDIDIEGEGWIITDSSPYNVETVLERINKRLHEHGLKVIIGDDKSSDVWFRIAKEETMIEQLISRTEEILGYVESKSTELNDLEIIKILLAAALAQQEQIVELLTDIQTWQKTRR